MAFELSIKVKISPNAVVTWMHGPWYADAIYEGMRANHGMSKKNVDDALTELRREGLAQIRADGEPEMCVDTRRGEYLKAEFCRMADIHSPPDAGAGMRLVMMFQPSAPKLNARDEAIIKGVEDHIGVVFTDDRGIVWTCDGKGNVTPSDGSGVRKVRDVIRIR